MKRLYLIAFALVFAHCLGNTEKAKGQTPYDSLTFNGNNIILTAGGGQFTFSNQNTSVSGFLRDGIFGPGNCMCFAGTTLNLRSVFMGNLSIIGGNPGLVSGNLYERIYFSGGLEFEASAYVLPFRYNRSRFTLVFPAKLKGTLTAHTENPHTSPAPPIFTTPLDLHGTVTVSLRMTGMAQTQDGSMKPRFKIYYAKYDFPPAKTVKSEK